MFDVKYNEYPESDSANLYSVSEVAKMIGEPKVGRKIIFRCLRSKGIVNSDNILIDQCTYKNLLINTLSSGYCPKPDRYQFNVLKITDEGIVFIRKILDEFRPTGFKEIVHPKIYYRML